MFSPTTLPPPPLLAGSALPGPGASPAGPYTEQDLLRQELNSRFLASQSVDRGAPGLGGPAYLRTEFHQHQHQHQHQHMHQHTHQHTFSPFPHPAVLPAPAPPPLFDKYPPKVDSFHRHNLLHSYPSAMPGVSPVLPPTGLFSSLQGAFQPKASNPLDVVPRPGTMPRPILQKESRLLDSACPAPKKPGKWCAMHVHIAWQVYHHQQKIKKQMQMEPHKLDFGLKPEFLSRPSGSGFMGMIQQPRDLPRPATIFSSAGPAHPPVSPYGPLPHPHSNLHTPPSHHDSLNKPPPFGGLGTLSSAAFGGLGHNGLMPSSAHGSKEGKAVPSSGGLQEPWNRLHQTPSSFPTPPVWPRAPEPERASGTVDRATDKRGSLLSKDEHERDAKDKLQGRRLSPVSISPPGHKQATESSRGPSPEPKDKDRSRERVPTQDPPNPCGETEELQHKETQQDKKEKAVKQDAQRPGEDKAAPEDALSPKQQRSEAEKRSNSSSSDTSHWEPDGKRSRAEPELQVKSVQVKVKEERREERDSPDVKTAPPKALELPTPTSRNPGIALSPLTSIHMPVGAPHSLDRTRLMSPFVGMSPLSAADRLPYPPPPPPQPWDPMRNMYRGLDLAQKDPQLPKELLLRADPLQRAMAGHHAYPREQLLHSLALEQQRSHLEEQQRLALLREESERSRLLALHHAAMEPHLAHSGLLPAYANSLFPRLGLPHGPPHYAAFGKTLPPAGYIQAPPPSLLLPPPLPPLPPHSRAGSPRRTTPAADRHDKAAPHPHRDAEAP